MRLVRVNKKNTVFLVFLTHWRAWCLEARFSASETFQHVSAASRHNCPASTSDIRLSSPATATSTTENSVYFNARLLWLRSECDKAFQCILGLRRQQRKCRQLRGILNEKELHDLVSVCYSTAYVYIMCSYICLCRSAISVTLITGAYIRTYITIRHKT